MIGVGLGLAAFVAILPLIGNVAPFAVPAILTAILVGSWWMTSAMFGRPAAALLVVLSVVAFVQWHEAQGVPVPRGSICTGHVCE